VGVDVSVGIVLDVGVGVGVSVGIGVGVNVTFFSVVAFPMIAVGIVSTVPGGNSLLNVMIPADTTS
jgi:hypothetical protein